MVLSVLFALCVDGEDAGFVWDSRSSASRVAFASCHSMRRVTPNGVFERLREYTPERFFWTGDAVYVNTTNTTELSTAYSKMTTYPPYTRFVESIGANNIDGTWDDHDYGLNDAGKELTEKPTRQQLFLNFIGKDDNPRRGFTQREGVYSSHLIERNGRRVAVILLDTRTHRAPHYVPSFSRFRLPQMAYLSAVCRMVCSMLRLYSSESVLGARQEEWLDALLEGYGGLDGYVVVSSIQVTTSNPFVESWGHFPNAKNSLLRRFSGKNGVIFISGDVHVAEMMAHEITSSGMTHVFGVGATYIPGLFANRIFNSHLVPEGARYSGKNFLGLDIDWEGNAMRFGVRSAETGDVVLARTVLLGVPTEGLLEAAVQSVFVHTETPFGVSSIAVLTVLATVLIACLIRKTFGTVCARKPQEELKKTS